MMQLLNDFQTRGDSSVGQVYVKDVLLKYEEMQDVNYLN